jgi:hypothetical protein
MPRYFIRTINSTFETQDQGNEYLDLDTAYRAAVDAGIAMAADEIHQSATVGVIAIHIEDAAGQLLARGVVSLATSPLIVS